MKRIVSVLLLVSLLAGLLSVGASAAQGDTVELQIVGTNDYSYSQEVLRLVNIERAKVGLSPLRMNTILLDAAMLRAAETSCVFDHSRPDGSSCYSAIDDVLASGQTYPAWSYGENIAAGQTTPQQVVEAWMASDGHRANILEPTFTDIGVGCLINGHNYYWTQMFSGGQDMSAYDASGISGTQTCVYDVSVSRSAVDFGASETEVTVHTESPEILRLYCENSYETWMTSVLIPYSVANAVYDAESGALIATVSVDAEGNITLTGVGQGEGVLLIYPYAGAEPVEVVVCISDEHLHSFFDHVFEPTCTSQGYTAHSCLCGRQYNTDYTKALGHDYQNGACVRCGMKAPDDDPTDVPDPNGTQNSHVHQYTTVDIIAPTCTQTGYTLYTCSCGATYKDKYTDALGHQYHSGRCILCGASDPSTSSGNNGNSNNGNSNGNSNGNGSTVSFKDVAKTAWYKDAVDYAVANGLMNGMGNNTFEPDTPTTRAMLVTVLWRYEGSPIEGKNIFKDIRAGQWFTEAVAWASENGIVKGVGESRFDPEGKLTREQLAAILFRYAKQKGIDTSARADFGKFADGKKVQSWSKESVQWAVAEGIIGGTSENGKLYLDPQGNATRAQVATILMRFIENVLK